MHVRWGGFRHHAARTHHQTGGRIFENKEERFAAWPFADGTLKAALRHGNTLLEQPGIALQRGQSDASKRG